MRDSNSPRNKDFEKYVFLHHVVVGLYMKVPICMGFLQKKMSRQRTMRLVRDEDM